MDKSVYNAVAARANGRCEACGASGYPFPLECDHFFGRSKLEEQEFNCWLLCRTCHHRKSANSPSAVHCLLAFNSHCSKYVGDGYRETAYQAQKKLDWLTARKGVLP